MKGMYYAEYEELFILVVQMESDNNQQTTYRVNQNIPSSTHHTINQ